MARYRRRYTRTIVRAPRKKWGSNFKDINLTIQNTTAQTQNGYNYATIAENSAETGAPTPVVVKTGNFRVQGDMFATSTPGGTVNRVSVTLYIIFVPQGFDPATYEAAIAIINNHPEWILSWRVLESGFSTTGIMDSNRFTMTSRLKRNLNSGDKICAIFVAKDIISGQRVDLVSKVQYWTCAN